MLAIIMPKEIIMNDDDPAFRYLKRMAATLVWGWIFVGIYNSVFAPFRFVFGLRFLPYTVATSFFGWLLIPFCFFPTLLIVGTSFLRCTNDPKMVDPSIFVEDPLCNPWVDYGLCPVILILFF